MSSLTLRDYCRILGVSEHATVSEIRQAYRRKAVTLHPDVNKAPNAHEQFLQLVEAYQYMLNRQTGTKDKSTTRPSDHADAFWQEYAREEVRRKAREYAEMKYKDFRASNAYPKFDFMNHLSFFFFTGAMLLMPLILWMQLGKGGLIVAGCIWIITSPITIGIIRSRPDFQMKNFFRTLWDIVCNRYFMAAAIFLFNVICFFVLDLRTVIDLTWLFVIFLGSAGLGYLVGQVDFRKRSWKKNSVTRNVFHAACLGPLAVHLLLLVNFSYTRYPVKETLNLRSFTWYYNEPFTSYELAHANASAYSGVEFYVSFHRLDGCQTVHCTFGQGLLGIPVLSEYYFTF